MNQRPDLGGITAPTLVVSGDQDQALPPEQQQVIADGVPGARLITVSPAAHIASIEQADQVTAALLTHLTGAAE